MYVCMYVCMYVYIYIYIYIFFFFLGGGGFSLSLSLWLSDSLSLSHSCVVRPLSCVVRRLSSVAVRPLSIVVRRRSLLLINRLVPHPPSLGGFFVSLHCACLCIYLLICLIAYLFRSLYLLVCLFVCCLFFACLKLICVSSSVCLPTCLCVCVCHSASLLVLFRAFDAWCFSASLSEPVDGLVADFLLHPEGVILGCVKNISSRIASQSSHIYYFGIMGCDIPGVAQNTKAPQAWKYEMHTTKWQNPHPGLGSKNMKNNTEKLPKNQHPLNYRDNDFPARVGKKMPKTIPKTISGR